jgi:uncharacterized protein YndB with AHSA1/START domain
METIKTLIDINSPAGKVLEAITTTAGHKAWWTTDAEVGKRPGETCYFRFNKEGGAMEIGFRIDRQDETGLEWTCTQEKNNPEWKGTRLAMRVMPTHAGTRLELEHTGWQAKTRTYEMCTGGWQHFMNSLKAYLESGVGTPFGK